MNKISKVSKITCSKCGHEKIWFGNPCRNCTKAVSDSFGSFVKMLETNKTVGREFPLKTEPGEE